MKAKILTNYEKLNRNHFRACFQEVAEKYPPPPGPICSENPFVSFLWLNNVSAPETKPHLTFP